MADQAPAVVSIEACGCAHYWEREKIRLGREVKLIAPQYVKPFVKRQKNDAADAEAIVVAAQRPEMRFVEPKTGEQQSRAILFRARERLIVSSTSAPNWVNAVRQRFTRPLNDIWIVTFSSGAAQVAGANADVAYIASKAGIIGMDRQIAMDLGANGCTVNTLAPDPIATPAFRKSMSAEDQVAIAKVGV